MGAVRVVHADTMFIDVLQQHLRLHAERVEAGQPIRWLVAVSGGVDSMVLLDIARRICDRTGGQCVAGHVHHGLRAASDDEQSFVEQVCQAWQIPCETRRLRLSAEPPGFGGSRELVARERRYAALADIARSVHAQHIWTAHHADDQLETMLWRIARGTSLSGLSGMRPVAVLAQAIVVRPLLAHSRSAIARYASVHGVPHIEDESNASLDYTRNRIRHQVVPALRTVHPRVAEHASQLAEILQQEDEWLDDQARALLDGFAHPEKAGYRLDVAAFLRLAIPLQRRAIKILLYCLAEADWTTRHIEAIVQLAQADSPSSRIELSGSMSAWRVYESLWIGARPQASATSDYRLVWQLGDGAEMDIHNESGHWHFACARWLPPDAVQSPSLWEVNLPFLERVVVRSPRQGERMQPIGMSGSKKMQDVLTDAKIPRNVRWHWPIFADGADSPLWMPGVVRSASRLLAADAVAGWTIRALRRPLS